MTVAQRLAIMQTPSYERELDLVMVAPNGEFVSFCICGIEEGMNDKIVGYTDPIGTHPQYQRHGLGKAMGTAGLCCLKQRGLSIAELNTSSNNMPMQRLAESVGFNYVSEKLWFAKDVK